MGKFPVFVDYPFLFEFTKLQKIVQVTKQFSSSIIFGKMIQIFDVGILM